MTRILAIAAACALLQACVFTGATKAVVDVQTIEKQIPVRCSIEWPKLPTPYVSQVQLTADDALNLVLLWRAAEAELEERIAYEEKLEAAARKCVDGGPGP